MSGAFHFEKDPNVNMRVSATVLLTLAIFGSGVLWAYHVLDTCTGGLAPAGVTIPKDTRQPEVGIVMKTLFQSDTRYSDKREAQRASLHDFGWVDRDKQIIHIPIEQGIDRVLAREAGQGGH